MMHDQARELRSARSGVQASAPAATPCLVVGSGKGGVGKSLVAAGLAAAAARAGRRILLVDGDQNLGNLHVLLGVRPGLTLRAVIDGHAGIEELLIPVTRNLHLLPATSGDDAVQGLGSTDRARMQRIISGLYDDYDAVIVDAGAGLDSAMRCAAMRATGLVVVTLPEATALTDAYALIKIVTRQLPDLPIDVLVNRVQAEEEGPGAFARLSEGVNRFLNREISMLGWIPEDPTLRGLDRDPARLHDPAGAGAALAAIAAAMPDRLVRSGAAASPAN